MTDDIGILLTDLSLMSARWNPIRTGERSKRDENSFREDRAPVGALVDSISSQSTLGVHEISKPLVLTSSSSSITSTR